MPVTTPTTTDRWHTSFFSFSNARDPPSLLPRATNIPVASVAAASPTAGERRRRRHQSPPEASPVRTQLRESSLFSFLLLRARYARSWRFAVARHAAPALRLPAKTTAIGTAATASLPLAESTVSVNTFLCSKPPAISSLLCFSVWVWLDVTNWRKWDWNGGSDPVRYWITGVGLWFWFFALCFVCRMGWCCDVEVVFYEWECCGIGLGCCGIEMENEFEVEVRTWMEGICTWVLSLVSILYFCTSEWLRWKWTRKMENAAETDGWRWWKLMVGKSVNRMSEGVVFHLAENRTWKSPLQWRRWRSPWM